jgi:hypothetical protein
MSRAVALDIIGYKFILPSALFGNA